MSVHSCPECWDTICKCDFLRFYDKFESYGEAIKSWHTKSKLRVFCEWVTGITYRKNKRKQKENKERLLAIESKRKHEEFFKTWFNTRDKSNLYKNEDDFDEEE